MRRVPDTDFAAPRRHRTFWRSARWAATILGAAALVALAPALAERPAEQGKDASDSGGALAEVEDAARAAGQWIVRNLSPQRAEQLVDQARDAAAGLLEDVLRSADDSVRARTGLRRYTPRAEGRAAQEAIEWTPIGDADERLPERVVVLVHGLDEPGSIWRDAAPAIHEKGLPVIRFEYPNDQRIERSVDLFLAALRTLCDLGAERVDLVCHSMGGLVARDALTRPVVDRQSVAEDGGSPQKEGGPSPAASLPEGKGSSALPDIGRLIMVGTPNHGAPLVRLRLVAEAREHLSRWIDFDEASGAHPLAFLGDGAGEAGDDLKPGSDFLKDLNARPLPGGVRITIIAGALAPTDGGAIADLFESDIARRALGERAERLADDARTLASTVGDGVVPLDSARLGGVEDIVVVEANHRSMLKRLAIDRLTGDSGEPPPAIPVILDRLTTPAASR